MALLKERRPKEEAQTDLDKIWHAYSQKVKNFLIRTTGDEYDADDLTQKTFITLYAALMFEPIDKPWNWLLRTAGNHLLHYKRTKARQKNHEVFLEDAMDEAMELEAPPPSADRSDFISSLPDCINTKDKELLALYYFDRLSLREVAAQGGYTYGGFRVHLSGLLRKLRQRGPDVFLIK